MTVKRSWTMAMPMPARPWSERASRRSATMRTKTAVDENASAKDTTSAWGGGTSATMAAKITAVTASVETTPMATSGRSPRRTALRSRCIPMMNISRMTARYEMWSRLAAASPTSPSVRDRSMAPAIRYSGIDFARRRRRKSRLTTAAVARITSSCTEQGPAVATTAGDGEGQVVQEYPGVATGEAYPSRGSSLPRATSSAASGPQGRRGA